MKAILRSIFLTSENPSRTAAFYRDVAGLPLEQVGNPGTYVYWKVDDGSMQLAIHDAKAFADHAYPARRDSNLAHLYFKVPDQGECLRHLEALKIEAFAVDDVVVTVSDPDGRKVMFGTA